MYYEMQYKIPDPCFHTFEGDSGMAGICFAEGSEATDFVSAVRFRLGKMGRASVRGPAPPRPRQAPKSTMSGKDIHLTLLKYFAEALNV